MQRVPVAARYDRAVTFDRDSLRVQFKMREQGVDACGRQFAERNFFAIYDHNVTCESLPRTLRRRRRLPALYFLYTAPGRLVLVWVGSPCFSGQ